MRIGFVGLGIMGRPMALNLARAGHDLLVPERASLTEELRAAARVMPDNTSVAAEAEALILMLPDTPDVEAVLFGPDGVAPALRPGTLVIDMSSISPTATRDFAARVGERGCDYLDAPVSGGEVGARNAALTVMVGGPRPAFERALPLFEAMGKTITLVGESGAGQVTKVANQIIVALNIAAVSEALVLASKAGADPARVREALMGGFASSRILEVHAERMVKRTFAPGFRIALHQKDLNLALQAGRELGVALPNTATVQQLFSARMAAGGGGEDHSALVRAYEALASHSLEKEKKS